LEMSTILAARRYDSPSNSTAATASRRTSNDSGGVPPCPDGRGGTRWARRAASQASTAAGSDERGQCDNGDQTSQAGFENPPMVWSPSTSGRTEHPGHPHLDLLPQRQPQLAHRHVVDQIQDHQPLGIVR
jgi:hypothetical protein